ncbi:alpha-L-arabinofuranosidase C-terminal domain-containing protein [Microlunatus soli]|uniref:non-reducing end alpha-L-arabinofuranosidase n=1 Tax=Microlunatus soli TaxID=630515 RepID=A0A1H1WHM8_9ACTN|nr:alpha-L-arabinofuranosidase C-terminal domain-containing protein [Microlunatus soli]SDS96777.1 alpha-N-arabinofuranosidase [Microlunatus soli]
MSSAIPATHPNATHPNATIKIDTRHPVGTIDDDVYGHFLESAFFGNIEGGVMDEGSPLSLPDPGLLQGLRADVLELCQELMPAPIRWPGGNFTSAYHWTDGIGPKDDRPTRLELAWGSRETNRFGTDEFLAWCEAIGGRPYLAHSARDVDEAVRWVEYTNATGTTLAGQRARNGREQPWSVRYWGVGNEVYGPWQMGNRSAEQYARDAREHAMFMKSVDPDIITIGVGIQRGQHEDQEHWTRELLQRAGRQLDMLSMHLYGANTRLYRADYDDALSQNVHFETELQSYAALVSELSDRAGLDRPPRLVMDEWNIRHVEPNHWPEPQPGDDGGTAPRSLPSDDAEPTGYRVNRWDPRTLTDALFYAGVFNATHRTAGLAAPFAMTNAVNLVNANGIVVGRPGGAVRSTAFHVWKLYREQTGRTALASEVRGPARNGSVRFGDVRNSDGSFRTAPGTIPDLDVSATRAGDGSLRLAVINRNRTDTITAKVLLDDNGELPRTARIRCLGGDVDDPDTANTLDRPDAVTVIDHGEVAGVDGAWTFPPHSLSILTLTV